MNWSIDHIGIAVKDLKKSASFYLSLPGHALVEDEENLEHQVRIKFISCGTSLIELMEPISETSALAASSVKARRGFAPYLLPRRLGSRRIGKIQAAGRD